MKHVYSPSGVCSRIIELEVEDGIIKSAKFTGGCSGNAQGICALVQNCKIEEVIPKLKGIRCGLKDTSCPDQLSKALEQLT